MERKRKCKRNLFKKFFSIIITRPLRPGKLVFLTALFLTATLSYSILLAGGIYSYVDKNGIYHFTNVPTDSRFSKIEIDEKSVTLKGNGGSGYRTRDQGLHSYSVRARIDVFEQEIKRAAGYFGLDPALIKAVIRAESGGDPRAVSSKGALGLMQLMPATARELMVYDPFDPAENIWGGSRYLSWLMESFDGDIIAALAAYNSGPGTVEKYGGIPPYPETIQYIKRVLRFWKQAKSDS